MESHDELHERIENLEKLTKDNNKILHSMQSRMRWGTFLRVLYWVIIIGSMLGAYYFLQPYVEQLMEAYNTLVGAPDALKDAIGF